MQAINQDSVELMRSIAAQAGAGGATLFVFDRAAPEQPVRYLFNLGLSTETNLMYQQGIVRADPFLQRATTRRMPADDGLCVLDQHEVETAQQTPATRGYWEFMQRRGYCESAASVREIADDIYLVLGLMRAGHAPERLSASRVRAATCELFDRSSRTLVQTALRGLLRQSAASSATQSLTPRESEVVTALQRGLSNKRIAGELRMSEYTVENHLRRIYRKHGVHNRTSLMARIAGR